MLGNSARQPEFADVRCRVAFLRTIGLALFLGAILLPAARAQKSDGPDKPLPAKSKPTAFYTPEGQQQIADAIITESLDQIWEQADTHFERGEYNHLINLSRIIVQGNPRRVDVFANAAYLLWSTGQNDAATTFLQQGLAANSDNAYMYDELGAHFFYRLKDYPNAVLYYEKAVKFDCPFFTWSSLAHSYEKLDQWDKAVQTWEKAANFVTDARVGNTMKHNLARARAELVQRRKP
jgi:tetratricopeptide (TPR) repeat protein